MQAVRLGDLDSGHGCYPPRNNVQGSPNVFINSRPSHRTTDAWPVHCCGKCHPSKMGQGSSNVFINGLPQARVGDPTGCGAVAITGSENVFING